MIATLLQREPMLLRFHVSTAEAPRLKVGMEVEFTLKETQKNTYKGEGHADLGAAEAESRLVPVTAEVIVEKKFWLRPGSFAMVSIKFEPSRQFPLIPQTAARPSDRGFLAYVLEGGVVRERVLQTGMHTADGLVEIKVGFERRGRARHQGARSTVRWRQGPGDLALRIGLGARRMGSRGLGIRRCAGRTQARARRSERVGKP